MLSVPSIACKRRDQNGSSGAAGSAGGGKGGGPAGAAAASGATGGRGGTTAAGGGTSGSWTAVPGAAPCVLEVADPAMVSIVPQVWSACGAGCSTTGTKVLDTDDSVPNRMASARVQGSDVHVRLSTMWGGHYYMNAVRRLSDGALLAAVRTSGPTTTSCSPLGFAPSAPHVLGFQKTTASSTTNGTIVAAFLGASGLSWGSPVADVPVIQTSVFENELGWGSGLEDGSLRVMFPPTGGQLTVVDQGTSYAAHSAVGWGSLIVSNPALPGSPDAIIRAWEPDRPSRTIVAQPDTSVTSVALSDTRMVWMGVHGPGRWDGTYTAAEMYWTPFPAGKETVPIMGGTALAGIHGFLELQTWGDYAVAMGVPDQAMRSVLFVVRLSDARVWRIPARRGAFYVRLLAVTPGEIVVGEIDDSGDPGGAREMQFLTRYEIARLDDLAAM